MRTISASHGTAIFFASILAVTAVHCAPGDTTGNPGAGGSGTSSANVTGNGSSTITTGAGTTSSVTSTAQASSTTQASSTATTVTSQSSNGAGAGGGATSGSGGAGGVGGGGASTAYHCPNPPASYTGSPVPAGAAPSRVAGVPPSDSFNNTQNNFDIVEGPVWIDGALYVSEFGSMTTPPPSRILKITPDGTVSIAVPSDSGTNGLAVDPAGHLLGADHKIGGIVQFDLPSTTPTTLIDTYTGSRFNSPNDLAVASDGTIYFSDPKGTQAPSSANQPPHVYQLKPGAAAATIVTDYTNGPNGVTLSLDEKTLYVDGGNGVYTYPISTDGTVGAGTHIATSISGSDGMTVDCAGNLYVADSNATTVHVIDPTSGNKVTDIAVPGVQAPTNVAFGGADRKTLYITALGSGKQPGLFTMQMNFPGMPY